MNPTPLLTLAAGCLLAAALPALAVEPRVEDKAGFFKPETVQEANQHIRKIKEELGKDFIVETFPEIPESLRDEFRSMSRDQFFSTWARERGKTIGLHGVYVLIVKNPRRLETAWRLGDQSNITPAEGRRLKDLLLNGFRQNRFDATLLEAVRFFESHAAGRAAESPSPAPRRSEPGLATPPPSAGPVDQPVPSRSEPARPAPPVGSTPPATRAPSSGADFPRWLCFGVAVIAVIMLVRGLVRSGGGTRASGGPQASDASGGPIGGGHYAGHGGAGGYGGGLGRGALGGLLGGILGGYAANRYLGRRRENDDTPDLTGGSTPPGTGFGSAGSDFGAAGSSFGDTSHDSSSSSSFPDSSPSSDFGSSGSDFGGGGGGGGDFGSSGGDF